MMIARSTWTVGLRAVRRRETGMSLVEMAVAMAIVGILGIMAWRWVASTRAPMERPAIMAHLAEAQAAVEGYLLANHTLPCPAAPTTDGLGNCTAAGSVLIPWRTLGLSSRFGQLHYGVNQTGGYNLADTSLLTGAKPNLGRDLSLGIFAQPHAVKAIDDALTPLHSAIGLAKTQSDTVGNGLDWCQVLRAYAANPAPGAVLTAVNAANGTSVPVAFIIAHPGFNGVFEGNNAVVGNFDFPGRAQDNTYDDLAVAAGPADLSARIGCAARLSEMQAAAQGAYTAYDTARLVQEYWKLQLFDITQAESALEGAETGVLLAAMNLALAAGSAALAVASAANTEGITIFGIALAAANVVIATTEVTLAAIDLQEAKDALQAAKDKEVAARGYLVYVYKTFELALTAATRLDARGLNP